MPSSALPAALAGEAQGGGLSVAGSGLEMIWSGSPNRSNAPRSSHCGQISMAMSAGSGAPHWAHCPLAFIWPFRASATGIAPFYGKSAEAVAEKLNPLAQLLSTGGDSSPQRGCPQPTEGQVWGEHGKTMRNGLAAEEAIERVDVDCRQFAVPEQRLEINRLALQVEKCRLLGEPGSWGLRHGQFTRLVLEHDLPGGHVA